MRQRADSRDLLSDAEALSRFHTDQESADRTSAEAPKRPDGAFWDGSVRLQNAAKRLSASHRKASEQLRHAGAQPPDDVEDAIDQHRRQSAYPLKSHE